MAASTAGRRLMAAPSKGKTTYTTMLVLVGLAEKQLKDVTTTINSNKDVCKLADCAAFTKALTKAGAKAPTFSTTAYNPSRAPVDCVGQWSDYSPCRCADAHAWHALSLQPRHSRHSNCMHAA